MQKIAIYGLGANFNRYEMIFTSERCMGGCIVAYSDKVKKDIPLYVTPQQLQTMNVDVIIVTCVQCEDVLLELNDDRAIHYLDYFYETWDVDRRAVKFLDYGFVEDLAAVKKFFGGSIRTFVEIGANFAQDAVLVKKVLEVNDENIYVFEPHPQIAKIVKEKYCFNIYEQAVSDYTGKSNFYICDIDKFKNNGMSSLKDSRELYGDKYNDVEVDVIRMDECISSGMIPDVIDFLKIDVEGNTYEVLKGFGDSIRAVKMIQCEGDYHRYWEEETLFDKIFEYLWESGFRMIGFRITNDYKETDSLWAQLEAI